MGPLNKQSVPHARVTFSFNPKLFILCHVIVPAPATTVTKKQQNKKNSHNLPQPVVYIFLKAGLAGQQAGMLQCSKAGKKMKDWLSEKKRSVERRNSLFPVLSTSQCLVVLHTGGDSELYIRSYRRTANKKANHINVYIFISNFYNINNRKYIENVLYYSSGHFIIIPGYTLHMHTIGPEYGP